jgi:hypothetical protein
LQWRYNLYDAELIAGFVLAGPYQISIISSSKAFAKTAPRLDSDLLQGNKTVLMRFGKGLRL